MKQGFKKIWLGLFGLFWVFWLVLVYMDYNKDAKLENYQGEVKTFTGKVAKATYEGQRNFFGKYHNYVTFEDGMMFHLTSNEVELFCEGDTLIITYPTLFDKDDAYFSALSYLVKEKGQCGEIQVKDSRVIK